MRGTGFALNYVGLVASIYFIPIIAWGMVSFQKRSSKGPLPWSGDTENCFMYEVTGAILPDTSVTWVDYPGINFDGRLLGWNAFLFFLVWLCILRGTGWTGRVMYFTMGIVMLIGRGASLPYACDGIKLCFATWCSEALSGMGTWQDAVEQVLYSTGVGSGFYTVKRSYWSSRNAFLEASLAFAAFRIVGFMGITPDPESPMESYSLGFMTYPQVSVHMPDSNFWSALFAVMGVSSTFVTLDAFMTLIMDSAIAWSKGWTQMWVLTVLIFAVFLLLSLPDCTKFGYYYLDGIDPWMNNVGLVFVVGVECVSATTIYRNEDVVDQIGLSAYVTYNTGFLCAQLVCLFVGHTGNQLCHDFNPVIGDVKNWSLPFFCAHSLRYFSVPILATILSLAYPNFEQLKHYSLHVIGFIIGHFLLLWCIVGFMMPTGSTCSSF
ncbi:hypothetical protein BDU57DRAFT_545472 [Ampelomyces quisqualis]|uniref:Uncharacterized protein n=1 Tax=Ampelomyces quisqualis TaxID=50730 RepID=A0A6A5QUT2_AMPQU|nr:hypothetical protein BDU57DRAFT_545472 [Ampelomyces quisqualis]